MKNENFRVPEREELPQEEKYDEKTRGPELQKIKLDFKLTKVVSRSARP